MSQRNLSRVVLLFGNKPPDLCANRPLARGLFYKNEAMNKAGSGNEHDAPRTLFERITRLPLLLVRWMTDVGAGDQKPSDPKKGSDPNSDSPAASGQTDL